jgi:hypothetical protein
MHTNKTKWNKEKFSKRLKKNTYYICIYGESCIFMKKNSLVDDCYVRKKINT